MDLSCWQPCNCSLCYILKVTRRDHCASLISNRHVPILLAGYQIYHVIFNDPPETNKTACTLDPPSGFSHNTTFSVKCNDQPFEDSDDPLSYEIYVQQSSDEATRFLLRGPGRCCFFLVHNCFNCYFNINCLMAAKKS